MVEPLPPEPSPGGDDGRDDMIEVKPEPPAGLTGPGLAPEPDGRVAVGEPGTIVGASVIALDPAGPGP